MKDSQMDVYVFNIFYNQDVYEKQERYVLADSLESAEFKIESYRAKLVKDGFCDFTWVFKEQECYQFIDWG